MTTQEMIAVMQAAVDGKEIECRYATDGEWARHREPLWDWSSFTYRIKPTPPRRVFTLADFHPGTLVRHEENSPDTWELMIGRMFDHIHTQVNRFYLRLINDGGYKGWSFSTDSGKTWQPLVP